MGTSGYTEVETPSFRAIAIDSNEVEHFPATLAHLRAVAVAEPAGRKVRAGAKERVAPLGRRPSQRQVCGSEECGKRPAASDAEIGGWGIVTGFRNPARELAFGLLVDAEGDCATFVCDRTLEIAMDVGRDPL